MEVNFLWRETFILNLASFCPLKKDILEKFLCRDFFSFNFSFNPTSWFDDGTPSPSSSSRRIILLIYQTSSDQWEATIQFKDLQCVDIISHLAVTNVFVLRRMFIFIVAHILVVLFLSDCVGLCYDSLFLQRFTFHNLLSTYLFVPLISMIM